MRNFTICLLVLAVFSSCEKLEEVNKPPSNSELQGKWELQSASCFCFFPDDFDFGAHKLIFNATANEVIVENSDDTFFVTAAGTYPIVVTNDGITINGIIEYTYRIENMILTLTFRDNPEIADDEISLSYLKI